MSGEWTLVNLLCHTRAQKPAFEEQEDRMEDTMIWMPKQ
jgi:hypothetical protein